MIKFKKYAIMMCIAGAISILHSFNIFAAEDVVGPGQNLESEAKWLVDAHSNLGSPELWAGWSPIRFGAGIDARLKPGDTSHSDIIYTDRRIGKIQGTGAAKGYGIYQILLEKHMVGYLYYIKNKVATKKKVINSEGNEEEETLTVLLDGVSHPTREACEYVANKLMSSAYSVADRNLLHILLDTIVIQNKAEDIKDWQTDYWYNVFGSAAYDIFKDLGVEGAKGSDIISGHEKQFRGALLSIMSDRYMNKSLMGKTNLKLKVKKGDLWPFLVYTTTYDNGNTTLWEYEYYKVDKNGKKQKKKTTWDDLIRGAYYYMVYYEYKYDYEGDIELDEDVIYNSTKADQFVQEYQALTGKAFVELTGAELDDFYQKIRTIRRIYKKSDENGALFGEEEDYSINSDITYSQAMNNIERKMQTQPFKDLFDHTLGDDYIARTYLMAKNIAENHRLTNQNAQYDIGSNILQRTPGGRDHTVLLTDLQKIQLKATAFGFIDDADYDGILDGNEMGTYKQVDITKFVEHMLKAESGLSDVSALMENYRNNIRAANADPHKQNLVESQKDIDVDFWGNIKVMLMSYTSNPILKDTDFDGIDNGFGYQDKECTTFVNKNASNDQTPRDNKFDGEITMSNGNNFAVNTHMDYRYFFLDEYNYYDELAEMSLILSQSVYNRNSTNLTNINTIKEKIGLEEFKFGAGNAGTTDDIISPYINETINGVKYETNYAVGFKAIRYSKNNSAFNSSYIKKLVIPIVIPGMTEISEAKSYSEIGKANWASEDSIKSKLVDPESHNVKSYEIYASLILSNLDGIFQRDLQYQSYISDGYKPVYWVTGYKEGGAIANIISSKLRDEGKSVYAYTFGAPMTIYNNPDEPGYTKTGYSARYDCIFNVVNGTDAYAYIMPQELGFSRYGKTCFGGYGIYNPITNQFEKDPESVNQIIKALTSLYKDKKGKIKDKVREETYKSNRTYLNLQNVLSRLITAIDINRNHKEAMATGDNDRKKEIDTIQEFYERYDGVQNLSVFIKVIQANYDKIKRAGQEDVYYNVAKNMQNADIVNVVNLHDNNRKKKLKVATGSELDGIHDGTFPCYQVLHNTNSNGATININNEVPAYFQSQEFWSELRYGTMYRETSDDLKINKYNDTTYSYGTFYASSCGACSPAMVLSYILDKTITPVDVRNMMELHNEEYRNPSATAWSSEGNIPGFFNVLNLAKEDSDRGKNSFSINSSNGSFKITGLNQKRDAIKYLLKGRPIIALCHDSGGKTNDNYGNHSSIFTGSGHYIVISGIGTDSLSNVGINYTNIKSSDQATRNAEIAIVDTLDDNQLDLIEIYVSDPAYYNVKSKTKKRNITPFKISTFYNNSSYTINEKGEKDWTNDVGDGGVDNMWLYGLGSDCGISGYDGNFETEEVNGKKYQQFDYNSETYYEEFDPESYPNYDTGSKKPINDGYDKYYLIKRINTWRTDACEK